MKETMSSKFSIMVILVYNTMSCSDMGLFLEEPVGEKSTKDTYDTVRSYYEAGELEVESQYLDGEQHGVTSSYYKNGSLESKVFYKNGKNVGEGYIYRRSGGIKSYYFYDHLGRLMYKANYDSNGVVINDQGNAFASVIASDTLLSVGEGLDLRFVCVSPPGTNTIMEIFEYRKDSLLNKYRYLDSDTIRKLREYNASGPYTWEANLTITSDTRELSTHNYSIGVVVD